jgi:hypothetical protein
MRSYKEVGGSPLRIPCSPWGGADMKNPPGDSRDYNTKTSDFIPSSSCAKFVFFYWVLAFFASYGHFLLGLTHTVSSGNFSPRIG